MLIRILLALTLILLPSNSALAFENIWYDLDTDFTRISEIAILPLEDQFDSKIDEFYLTNKLEKEFKKIDFIATRDQSNSEFYLIPRITQHDIQTDISPAVEISVPMKTWTEISDSPHAGTFIDRSWTEYHQIPERTIFTRTIALEFILLDSSGNQILTFFSNDFNISAEKFFKNSVDNFCKEFKRLGKSEKSKKSKFTIKLDEIGNPSEGFVFYLERGKLKNAILTDSDSDYVIQGEIRNSSLDFKWNPPNATTTDELIRTDEFPWRDRDGKDHKEQRKYYRTKIVDHLGYWSAKANVSVVFNLIDSKTSRTVVQFSNTRSDDKEIDALHHLVEDFLKKVNKYLKDVK